MATCKLELQVDGQIKTLELYISPESIDGATDDDTYRQAIAAVLSLIDNMRKLEELDILEFNGCTWTFTDLEQKEFLEVLNGIQRNQ